MEEEGGGVAGLNPEATAEWFFKYFMAAGLIAAFALFTVFILFVIHLYVGKKDLRKQGLAIFVSISFLNMLWWGMGYIFGPFLRTYHNYTLQALQSVWFIMLAFYANQLIDYYVWFLIFTKDGVCQIPPFLRRFISAFIYLIAISAIVAIVYHKDAAIIVAFSGGAAFILGYSASNVFGQLFAGIALNIAPSFKKGHVLFFEGEYWQVEDINWRFVTLKDIDKGFRICIPNSELLAEKIVNFDWVSKENAGVYSFKTAYNIPPQVVMDTVKKALPQVPHIVASAGVGVDITSFESGIKYEVKVILSSIFDKDEVGTNVYKIIWYALANKGIQMYLPDINLHYAQEVKKEWVKFPDQKKLLECFQAVPIFKDFKKTELEYLIKHAKKQECVPPQRLITYGDKDDSLHVIVQGKMGVYIPQADGGEIRVSELKVGDYPGVMALLTGEPRSAHVVAEEHTLTLEIDRAILKPLLEKNPKRIQLMAERVEEMQKQNIKESTKYKQTKAEAERLRKERLNTLVGKIRAFFGID